MIRLDARDTLAPIIRGVPEIHRRHLPFAIARALTQSAQVAKHEAEEEIRSVFDRPTPFTQRALFVRRAEKTTLAADIHFKDFAPKGVPAGRYLAPQIEGTARVTKAFERRLAAVGAIPPGTFLVPTKHADLDGHGNMRPGQIVKILSALRAQRNPEQNLRADGKSRGKRRREGYFVVKPGATRGGLPPAIYKVEARGLGRVVLPILTFARGTPAYTQRFDFTGVAIRSYRATGTRLLQRSIREAIESGLKGRRT